MSTQQMSLGFPRTRGASRRGGPQTATAAARSLDGQVLRDQQGLVLSALVAFHRRLCMGGNAWEIQCHLRGRGVEVQQNVIGKRLGELRERGMVEESAKRPGPSHRLQVVFLPTPDGLAWVQSRGEP